MSGRAAWRFRGIVPGGQRRRRLLGPRLAGQPLPGEVRTVAAAWHLGALRTRGEANSLAPALPSLPVTVTISGEYAAVGENRFIRGEEMLAGGKAAGPFPAGLI